MNLTDVHQFHVDFARLQWITAFGPSTCVLFFDLAKNLDLPCRGIRVSDLLGAYQELTDWVSSRYFNKKQIDRIAVIAVQHQKTS